jgi:hypothetical protein
MWGHVLKSQFLIFQNLSPFLPSPYLPLFHKPFGSGLPWFENQPRFHKTAPKTDARFVLFRSVLKQLMFRPRFGNALQKTAHSAAVLYAIMEYRRSKRRDLFLQVSMPL